MRDQKAIEFFFARVYKIKLNIILFELFKNIGKKSQIKRLNYLTLQKKQKIPTTCNEQSQ